MLLLTRVINLEWKETLLRLLDHIQFEALFGPAKQGSFFWSCVNQSGRYCDWNSDGYQHGLFYSQLDPVTCKRVVFQHILLIALNIIISTPLYFFHFELFLLFFSFFSKSLLVTYWHWVSTIMVYISLAVNNWLSLSLLLIP